MTAIFGFNSRAAQNPAGGHVYSRHYRSKHPMRFPFVRFSLVLALLSACSGCGQAQSSRKETFPVTGTVLVDGEPVDGLAVICTNLSGLDKEHPTGSQCFTKEDGGFEIGTYESHDGVPEGEYVLTFQWGEWNLMAHSYQGDKLNGRYSDAKKPVATFTVTNGQATELGEIELSTK